jgi:hypothetical protein
MSLGVDRKEPGGLARCSICGAVTDPTPWQVPVQGESSWFLLVSGKCSTVSFPSNTGGRGVGSLGAGHLLCPHGLKTGGYSYCRAKQGLHKIVKDCWLWVVEGRVKGRIDEQES